MLRLLVTVAALAACLNGFAAETTAPAAAKKGAAVTSSSLPSAAVPSDKVGKNSKFVQRHKEILADITKHPDTQVIFLGDSITDRWDTTAMDIWNSAFGKWNPVNMGVGGDKTQNVLWRIEHGELEGISPKVAVLMIGTNNTHADQPADIVTGIKQIIKVTQEKLPNTKILLLAVFPREPRMRNGKPVTTPMDRIKVINQELPKLEEPGKVRFLNINDKFLVNGKVPAEIMPDQVHPSEKGYRIWADAVVPVLEEMTSDKK